MRGQKYDRLYIIHAGNGWHRFCLYLVKCGGGVMNSYLSIFCEFKNDDECRAWMQKIVLKETFPAGGPIFSYSYCDESKYRDLLHEVLDFIGSQNANDSKYAVIHEKIKKAINQ